MNHSTAAKPPLISAVTQNPIWKLNWRHDEWWMIITVNNEVHYWLRSCESTQTLDKRMTHLRAWLKQKCSRRELGVFLKNICFVVQMARCPDHCACVTAIQQLHDNHNNLNLCGLSSSAVAFDKYSQSTQNTARLGRASSSPQMHFWTVRHSASIHPFSTGLVLLKIGAPRHGSLNLSIKNFWVSSVSYLNGSHTSQTKRRLKKSEALQIPKYRSVVGRGIHSKTRQRVFIFIDAAVALWVWKSNSLFCGFKKKCVVDTRLHLHITCHKQLLLSFHSYCCTSNI